MHGLKSPFMEKLARMIRASNLAESYTVPKLAILSTISRSTSVCPPRQKYQRLGSGSGTRNSLRHFAHPPTFYSWWKSENLLSIFDPSCLWFARSFGGLGPGRLEDRDFAILWFLRCRPRGPRILFKHDYH